MKTTSNPSKPSLLATRLSLPMWTNEELELEITELKHYIHDQERIDSTQDLSYYKDKLDLLVLALNTRLYRHNSKLNTGNLTVLTVELKKQWIEED